MALLARSLVVMVSIVAGTSTAAADAGDQWCRHGWDWLSKTSLVFKIHPGVAAEILDENGTPWTTAELELEVRYAIERLMDQAPSGLPPIYFGGYESSGTTWNAPPDGADIVLRPNHNIDKNQCTPHQSGDSSGGVHLHLSNGLFSGCPVRYKHWNDPPASNTIKTLSGTFMHELMHGLGFLHSNACQTTLPSCTDNPGEEQYCGLMAGASDSEFAELEYADWDALTSVYDGWEGDGVIRRSSSDAVTWSTRAGNGLLSGPNWGSGRGAGGSTAIPILAPELASQVPHFWLWNSVNDTFIDYGVAQIASNFGQVAMSIGSGYYYMFLMSAVNQNYSVKQPRYAFVNSPNGAVHVSTSQYASRQGVTGVWDPKTAKLIHAWRNRDNQVVMAISTPTSFIGTGTVPAALASDANKAFSTPSIACGPATLSYNCLMVWATAAAGPSDQYHVMRWVHFSVSGTTINFDSTIYQNGYVMYGPPQAVYRGPTTSNSAFVVAFKNPGRCFYTLVKGTSTTSAFNTERSHCAPVGAHIGPPMIGSTSGGLVEAWAQYNLQD